MGERSGPAQRAVDPDPVKRGHPACGAGCSGWSAAEPRTVRSAAQDTGPKGRPLRARNALPLCQRSGSLAQRAALWDPLRYTSLPLWLLAPGLEGVGNQAGSRSPSGIRANPSRSLAARGAGHSGLGPEAYMEAGRGLGHRSGRAFPTNPGFSAGEMVLLGCKRCLGGSGLSVGGLCETFDRM